MSSPYNFVPGHDVKTDWYWGKNRFWGRVTPYTLDDHPLTQRERALRKAIRERDIYDALACVDKLDYKEGVEVMLRAGLSVSVMRCGRAKFQSGAALDIQRAIREQRTELPCNQIGLVPQL